jgi:hypothetical protein
MSSFTTLKKHNYTQKLFGTDEFDIDSFADFSIGDVIAIGDDSKPVPWIDSENNSDLLNGSEEVVTSVW